MPNSTKQVFVPINNRMISWWALDPKSESARFLRRLYPAYFLIIRDGFAQTEDERSRLIIQTQIRMLRDQAAEMLLAIVFASVQAPFAPALWLIKYRNSDLDKLIELVQAKKPILTQLGEKTVGWAEIAQLYLDGVDMSNDIVRDRHLENISSFLERIANEYIHPVCRSHYTSAKHGLRISPGHQEIKFSRESVLGENSDINHKIEGSGYGASFYAAVDLNGANHNYQLEEHYQCWNPESIHIQLDIIVKLIENICNWLRCFNGDRGNSSWSVPDDCEIFNASWKHVGGLVHSRFTQYGVSIDGVELPTKEKMIEMCKKSKPIMLY